MNGDKDKDLYPIIPQEDKKPLGSQFTFVPMYLTDTERDALLRADLWKPFRVPEILAVVEQIIAAREVAAVDAALTPVREVIDGWAQRRTPNGRPMLTTANVVDRLRDALPPAPTKGGK